MARGDEQTNLRFEKELKEWLREKAKVNKRSINSEVVVRLEESRRAEGEKEASNAT